MSALELQSFLFVFVHQVCCRPLGMILILQGEGTCPPEQQQVCHEPSVISLKEVLAVKTLMVGT